MNLKYNPRRVPALPGYGNYIDREDYEEREARKRYPEESREQADDREWEEKRDETNMPQVR